MANDIFKAKNTSTLGEMARVYNNLSENLFKQGFDNLIVNPDLKFVVKTNDLLPKIFGWETSWILSNDRISDGTLKAVTKDSYILYPLNRMLDQDSFYTLFIDFASFNNNLKVEFVEQTNNGFRFHPAIVDPHPSFYRNPIKTNKNPSWIASDSNKVFRIFINKDFDRNSNVFIKITSQSIEPRDITVKFISLCKGEMEITNPSLNYEKDIFNQCVRFNKERNIWEIAYDGTNYVPLVYPPPYSNVLTKKVISNNYLYSYDSGDYHFSFESPENTGVILQNQVSFFGDTLVSGAPTKTLLSDHATSIVINGPAGDPPSYTYQFTLPEISNTITGATANHQLEFITYFDIGMSSGIDIPVVDLTTMEYDYDNLVTMTQNLYIYSQKISRELARLSDNVNGLSNLAGPGPGSGPGGLDISLILNDLAGSGLSAYNGSLNVISAPFDIAEYAGSGLTAISGQLHVTEAPFNVSAIAGSGISAIDGKLYILPPSVSSFDISMFAGVGLTAVSGKLDVLPTASIDVVDLAGSGLSAIGGKLNVISSPVDASSLAGDYLTAGSGRLNVDIASIMIVNRENIVKAIYEPPNLVYYRSPKLVTQVTQLTLVDHATNLDINGFSISNASSISAHYNGVDLMKTEMSISPSLSSLSAAYPAVNVKINEKVDLRINESSSRTITVFSSTALPDGNTFGNDGDMFIVVS